MSIYVEISTSGKILQVYWDSYQLKAKYGPGAFSRVCKVVARKDKQGIMARGNLWARLPSKTKTEDINKKAKEQVKDLALRYLFQKYHSMDLSEIPKTKINMLLYDIKDVFGDKF